MIGRKPRVPAKTVCTECKNPAHHRGCYGCFGPAATSNTAALIPVLRRDGMSKDGVERVFSTFNVTAFTNERNDR